MPPNYTKLWAASRRWEEMNGESSPGGEILALLERQELDFRRDRKLKGLLDLVWIC